jgi:hypothetical protein
MGLCSQLKMVAEEKRNKKIDHESVKERQKNLKVVNYAKKNKNYLKKSYQLFKK